MVKNRRHIIGFFLFAFISVPLPAAPIKLAPVIPVNPRLAAMGGPHAAGVGGFDALFENPAGFVDERTVLSVSTLGLAVSGPVFDIANLFLGGGDLLSGLVGLLDPAGRLLVGADLGGPLAFGYVGKGLGFGVFNRTVTKVDAVSALNATATLAEEILVVGGYAHRFELGDGHLLDLGIMPKAFMRAQFTSVGTVETAFAPLMNPATLLGATPFAIVSGIGFDLGLRWDGPFGLSAGIVARDLYSPAMLSSYASFADYQADPGVAADYAVVPADLSIGLRYGLPFAFLRDLGIETALLVDYRDLLDLFTPLPRNPILNLSAGAEFSLLEILYLRGGFRDGLPSAGFGVDLSWFTMNLAMYGTEAGLEPGARPVFNLALSFDFRY